MNIKFDLPEQVVEILGILKEHTYTPVLVGDCVREMICGEKPRDFDIVADIEPERIAAIFEERFKTTVGKLPGEMILISGAMGISVSPYRGIGADGKEIYGRRELTLDDDLRHRVYTADAIAYSPETGLYDPFGGAECISERRIVLRAVGEREAQDEEAERRARAEAERRSKKDKKAPMKPSIPVLLENPTVALNAVRRLSQSGIAVSGYTLKALSANRSELIGAVPREWLSVLMKDVLLGKKVTDALLTFRPIVFELIPKLAEEDGYPQRSIVQEYPLFEHIARSVGYAVPDGTIRLALLLHGIGKRDCEADRGIYNSYDGHEERGAMLAREILKELVVPAEEAEEIEFLILHHDEEITEENLSAFTAEYGIPRVKSLLLFQAANLRAKNPDRAFELRAAELRALADGLERPRGRGR
ncbi:MAG: hypothetical protein NC084_07785 [Bacteroides sp.]|nr:hypothetical protein [Eubacterium sp.]MCM1418522.1 hypothetical protein [Roseburia sp.]MCM1462597.1 hypothetical protein [Bacteroides sp.]